MRRFADGSPIVLDRRAGADERASGRARVTVTEEGYGAIEFVDADGEVVEAFVPERERDGSR